MEDRWILRPSCFREEFGTVVIGRIGTAGRSAILLCWLFYFIFLG